jgi:hypothetical protein
MDYYKENIMSEEAPIINDAITSDDAGFSSDVGDQEFQEESVEVEASEEGSEEAVEAPASEEGVQAETKEELKEEIEEAIEDGATDEEIQDMIREYTIKVNGKEKQVKIDFNDKEDIIRRLQLAEVSQKSMQDKRELEKSYEEEVKNLLDDPFAVLEELGLDPLKLAEERIRNEVEERKKSPELRDRERIERELIDARAQLKRQEEASESAKRAQLEAEASQSLNDEIDRALDAHPKLPRSQKTVTRIADHMLWAMENAEELGIDADKLRVEDVIPSVEQEMREEIQSLMKELPEEMMEEYIGKQNLERLRKKRLSTQKPKPNSASDVKPTTASVSKKDEASKAKEKQKAKDYFRNL